MKIQSSEGEEGEKEEIKQTPKIEEFLDEENMDLLLTNLLALVKRTEKIDSEFSQRQLSIISKISSFVIHNQNASKLLELFQPFLKNLNINEGRRGRIYFSNFFT